MISMPRLSLLPSRSAEAPMGSWQVAGIAVVWAVATSAVPVLLLVLVGWLATAMVGDLGGPLWLAADVWLAAHGVPVDVVASATAPAGAVTLRPLGLTAVVLVLLWRAGRWAGRNAAPATTGAAAWLTARVAVGYAGAAVGIAVLAATPVARPNPVVAGVAGVVLVALVTGAGVLSGSGQLRTLRARVPVVVRVALEAGAGAAVALVGLAALVLAGALALSGGRAHELTAVLAPEGVGWPLLLLVNLLLAPNAVLATLAYATGPGFVLGAGTTVSVGGTQLGDLPPLGLFAALPGSPTPAAATYAVLLVPVLAGLLAGVLAIRRSDVLRPERAALAGLGAGAVAGVLVGAATWAAAGGVGPGRLAHLGATGWLVGLVVAAQVGVLAAATAWVGCPRGRTAETAGAAAVVTVAPEARVTAAAAVPAQASASVGAVRSSPARSTPAAQQPAEPRPSEARPATVKPATTKPAPGEQTPPTAEPSGKTPTVASPTGLQTGERAAAAMPSWAAAVGAIRAARDAAPTPGDQQDEETVQLQRPPAAAHDSSADDGGSPGGEPDDGEDTVAVDRRAG